MQTRTKLHGISRLSYISSFSKLFMACSLSPLIFCEHYIVLFVLVILLANPYWLKLHFSTTHCMVKDLSISLLLCWGTSFLFIFPKHGSLQFFKYNVLLLYSFVWICNNCFYFLSLFYPIAHSSCIIGYIMSCICFAKFTDSHITVGSPGQIEQKSINFNSRAQQVRFDINYPLNQRS